MARIRKGRLKGASEKQIRALKRKGFSKRSAIRISKASGKATRRRGY